MAKAKSSQENSGILVRLNLLIFVFMLLLCFIMFAYQATTKRTTEPSSLKCVCVVLFALLLF